MKFCVAIAVLATNAGVAAFSPAKFGVVRVGLICAKIQPKSIGLAWFALAIQNPICIGERIDFTAAAIA